MPNSKANVSPSRRKAPGSGWVTKLRGGAFAGAKYEVIAQALAEAIESGELSPGERLPAQRTLAEQLNVDLTTITRAYSEVRALGLLEGEAGRGTFVRADGTSDGPLVDLSMNIPPPPQTLAMRDLVTEGLNGVLRRGDPAAFMTYRTGMGSRRDRQAANAWLAPRLGDTALDRISLAAGAQAALAALLPMLTRPGDVILTEPLTYPGFIAAARLYGVRLAAIPCDADGPIPKQLALLCQRHAPRALYLTPTLQNPTAITTSAVRRAEIVAVARRFDLPIIEDDAYGAFDPDMQPLAALAPERTYFVSTLSKCLSPGLRTAFIVAPDENAAAKVREASRAISLMPTPMLADMATRWIEDGTARRLFKAVKLESAFRLRMARAILPDRLQGGAGFHQWLPLPPRWTLPDYVAAARTSGVVVTGGDLFAVDPDCANGVRISLGVVSERAQLSKGLQALAELETRLP